MTCTGRRCRTGPASRACSTKGVTQAPDTGGPDRHTTWLTTINPDGSPHVTAVGAVWVDGAFWFQTGDGTRKAKNVARDERCTISVSTREFDLVVDGTGEKVSDQADVARRSRVGRRRLAV